MIKQKITVLAAGLLLITAAGFCLLRSKRIEGKAVKGDALPLDPNQMLDFKPISLTAFKNAKKLKGRYDSVAWFEHINSKTWFYVVKGKFNFDTLLRNKAVNNNNGFKMGLVSPDLKEIIPPKFDLIHNIGGTIDGLIEVESGNKKGLYNLQGKAVVPAIYDEIIPLEDSRNLAILLSGNDYSYLKNDYSITKTPNNFKVADAFPLIKNLGHPYIITNATSKNVLEYNSKEQNTSILMPPSYLVDWAVLPRLIDFLNPLREHIFDKQPMVMDQVQGELSLKVSYEGEKNHPGFISKFSSILQEYLGSRTGLYEIKNVMIVDKRKNRVLGFNTADVDYGAQLSGLCNDNYLRAINDTLFEFKTTAKEDRSQLNDKVVNEAPLYHYLYIKNDKLTALPNDRLFGFTKCVKMDNSYLHGCYVFNEKRLDSVTTSMLEYAKNEIYASYQYRFKSEKWNEVFENHFRREKEKLLANVDDSLTAIDKYNINWINKKLKAKKPAN